MFSVVSPIADILGTGQVGSWKRRRHLFNSIAFITRTNAVRLRTPPKYEDVLVSGNLSGELQYLDDISRLTDGLWIGSREYRKHCIFANELELVFTNANF